MFYASNPSGNFLANGTYRAVLITALVVGFLTALKNFSGCLARTEDLW
jgi:hypothetical protein